jgi:hypothetical protein
MTVCAASRCIGDTNIGNLDAHHLGGLVDGLNGGISAVWCPACALCPATVKGMGQTFPSPPSMLDHDLLGEDCENRVDLIQSNPLPAGAEPTRAGAGPYSGVEKCLVMPP